MKYAIAAAGITALLFSSACTNNDDYVAKLRAATDSTDVTLRDAVAVAEAEAAAGNAVNAALLVEDDPSFSVKAHAAQEGYRYNIDLQGGVVSTETTGLDGGPCGGSISIVQAIDVAQAEAGGEAVAIVPDDDVDCAFEIQVLQPDNLWEVKVSMTGEVLESEDSDEDGTPDVD